MTEHKIICDEDNIRVDKFISACDIGLSRNAAVNLIDKGLVVVDGKEVNKKYKLKIGQTVSVSIPEPVPYSA